MRIVIRDERTWEVRAVWLGADRVVYFGSLFDCILYVWREGKS